MNFLSLIAPAMRGRNYRIFFWSQLVSYIGTGLQSVTMSALVYDITGHSTFWVSAIVFLGLVPSTCLCPTLGGIIVDRYPIRRVMYVTQSCCAFQALVMVYFSTHDPQLWQMVAATLLISLASSVDGPARHRLMMDIVEPAHIPSAQALNGVLVTAGSIIGGALAGVVFVVSKGYAGAFAVNALSYLAVLGTLHMMTLHEADAHTGSSFSMLLSGARYVFHEKTVLFQLILVGVFSAIGFSYRGILPAIAREIYHADSNREITSIAGFVSAALAAGAVCGGLTVSRYSERLSSVLKPFVLWGSVVMGLSWIVFPMIHTSRLGLAFMFVFGAGFNLCFHSLRAAVKQYVRMHDPDMMEE